MTGAAVFNQALREIRRLELDADAERDFVLALEAARPGPLDLFYGLAHEAGLSRDELMLRTAGLFCGFAAGNLADDLIDGDCDYLSRPAAIGPSVQYGLQHLGYALLLRSDTDADAVAAMARHLALAGGAEHRERGSYDAQKFIDVAEGIAGLQWQGYLPVLWAGREGVDSSELGRVLGLALHVAEDIRSRDERFVSMSLADRRQIARWGLDLIEALKRAGSPCLARVADTLRPTCANAEGDAG